MVKVCLAVVEPLAQLRQVHGCQFRDVLIPYLIRQCLAIQSLTMTFRTLTLCQELVGPLLSAAALVVLHDRLQVLDDAVEVNKVVTGRMHQVFVNAHTLQRAIENLVQGLFGNVFYLGLEVAFVFLQDGIYLPENHLVLIFPQRDDGTIVDVLLAVGDDLVKVYLVDVA